MEPLDTHTFFVIVLFYAEMADDSSLLFMGKTLFVFVLIIMYWQKPVKFPFH